MTKIIDESLLDELTRRAQSSPRLRINYNFHKSLDEKCHRMLNAVEPGTDIPIHRHPDKDESFVIFRGKVRVTTHNDDGSIIEDVVLSQESGNYGVDIPEGVWHKLESQMMNDFKWKYPSYEKGRIPEEYESIEWLSLMQHYGSPTRMLDFSNSLYVALFMALDGSSSDKYAIGAINKNIIKGRLEEKYKEKKCKGRCGIGIRGVYLQGGDRCY